MKKIIPGISQIIHTKNEERNIRDCILSAKQLVDEVIVIDMSSTDKTVKIARSLGAKVIVIPDKGFVDDHRNFGFTKTDLPWIISFDADERLTKKLASKLQKIIIENKYDVVLIPRKNIRFGMWTKHGGWWPDNQPRLFKKGFLEWPPDINSPHLQPIIKGKVLTLDAREENAIVHYNIKNLKHILSKISTFSTLTGSGNFFGGNKITPEMLFDYFEGRVVYRFIENEGFKDRLRGYVFAKLREYAGFVEFVNWWEREGYPEMFNRKKMSKVILEKEKLKGMNDFQLSRLFEFWRIYQKYKKKMLNIIRKIYRRNLIILVILANSIFSDLGGLLMGTEL